MQQRDEQTRRYYQQRQQHPQPETLDNPVLEGPRTAPSGVQLPGGGPTFTLTAVRFDASHFLSAVELQKLARPYIGEKIKIADLQAITDEINQLYVARDIYTARAVLPAQKIEDGVVYIELVEGKLGAVQIKDNHYTRSRFIRERMTQKSGEVVDGARLREDLVYFNRTNATQLRAVLRPGARKGLTRVLLLAQEPRRVQLDLFGDNAGSESVGRYRGGLSFRMYGPAGIDDRLDGYLVGSEGSVSGFASYSLPVNRHNGRLGLSVSRNTINIVQGPFEALDIDGHSQSESISYTQPFIATRNWLGMVATSLSHSRSVTEASNVSIGRSEIEKLELGFTLVHTAGQHQWSMTHTATGIVREGQGNGRRHFFLYNGEVGYVQALGDSPYSLLLNLAGQYSPVDDPLPSQVLFQIGGVNTVRGYLQGALGASGGFYGRAELHRSIGPWLDVFAFADAGSVRRVTGQSTFLASAGPGFSVRYKPWLDLDFSAGFPLRNAVPDQDDYRINFSLTFHLL